MSQRTWNLDHGPMRGFYRDRENGWIFGVCAGLSDRFNLNLGAIRLIAVVSLFLFFWLTAAIYLGATVLIREKPLVYSGRESEFAFWRRRHRDYWRRS
jgi:phage shock protein PspC (stress-responsive transcriptional regulator)